MAFYGHKGVFEARVQKVDPEAEPWLQVRVGIYVKDAAFNGARLDELAISARDMMAGGELVVTMTERVENSRLS